MFKNIVCWRQDRVERVMDTEALQPSRAVFLATHHPIRMYRGTSVKGSQRVPYDEQQFLQELLAPRDYAFAAVLGESGTGKSHLIRWLDLNISRTEDRRVLLIPKVGTNLKSIIGRILEGMRGPKFEGYRRRLEEATQALSDGEARERLLSNLAIAIGPNQARDRVLTATERYLVDHLPDFLLDGVLRRHLLRDGGRLHELVTHILGRSERAERIERPREFCVQDLPLDGVVNLPNAGASARQVYTLLLADEQMRLEAVRWLNENLGIAIRHLLNLSGESLLELMIDVREELGDQGIELVILIEDFAKLQGIDRQLLEALLMRSHQEGHRPLCALRTALAVTTGYFERLDDTVKTRVTFRVDMDVTSTEAGGVVTTDDVERFASRYLNAIRLPEQRLEDWGDTVRLDPDEPAPIACEGCEHKDACHAAFGERDGVGLYPFNPTAVRRAVERVSSGGQFNPRQLINRVMRETFDKYTGDIRLGAFPSPALQQQFGQSRLTAFVKQEIKQRDPANWERRQVLLDLWSSGEKVVDLPIGVHEAFSLPPLGVETVHHDVEHVQEKKETVPTLPPRLLAQLKDLDDWQNGRTLEPPQVTASAFRELVFRAVVEHIDWDAELLHKGSFVGRAGRIFQKKFITFTSQQERYQLAAFRLIIPVVAADLTEAALALQGLLLYEFHGNWTFQDGSRLRRVYLRQLEKWSAAVLRAIRRPTQSGAEWDPVPLVSELLALGARLNGVPSRVDADIGDHIEACFAEWQDGGGKGERDSAWRDLVTAFSRKRLDLINQFLARACCTKGGGSKVQIIDAARIVPVVRALRSEWRVRSSIPADATKEFDYLAELRRRATESLEETVDRESDRLRRWHQDVAGVLGEGEREAIVSSLREVVVSASEAGVSASARALQESIEGFPTKQALKGLREVMARLDAATDLARKIAEASRDLGPVMSSIDSLRDAADQYLTATEQRVKERERELAEGGGDTLDSVERQLLGVVTTASECLSALKEDSDAP